MGDKKDFKLPETFDIGGVEIFATGKWNGDKYTDKDLDSLVVAFKETKDALKPYLKLGHNEKQKMTDGMPSIGWIERLRKIGNKLIADFKGIPKAIKELIEAGAYRRVSSEIYFNAMIGGKKYPRALKAVSLLGGDTPAVENLEDIIELYNKELVVFKTENEAKVYEYNIGEDNNMELEEAKKTIILLEKENEEVKADNTEVKKENEDVKKENVEVKAENTEVKKENEELKKTTRKIEDEKSDAECYAICNKAITDKKIMPSQKDGLFAILKIARGVGDEKHFKVGDKEVNAEEIVKSFVEANDVSKLNTDEHSDKGKTKRYSNEDEELADKAQKYAIEHKVSVSEATIIVGEQLKKK